MTGPRREVWVQAQGRNRPMPRASFCEGGPLPFARLVSHLYRPAVNWLLDRQARALRESCRRKIAGDGSQVRGETEAQGAVGE